MEREPKVYSIEEIDDQIKQLMKPESGFDVAQARKILRKLENLRGGFVMTEYQMVEATGAADEMDPTELEEIRKKSVQEVEDQEAALKKHLLESGAFASEAAIEKAMNILESEAAK